jgi:uncharacterized protein YecE (DUF72 family)
MSGDTNFYIGTSGWTYDDWKGDFYPTRLPKSRWFEFYAQHFNAVEINATFYRIFKPETYQKWRQKAPPGFRYAIKAPKLMTHNKMLAGVCDEITDFYRCAQILEESFGMILLQLSPRMPLDYVRLTQALQSFLDPTRVAVEFRHAQWDGEQTRDVLQRSGAAYVCTDSHACHLQERLTGKRAYIRLHGRRSWYADNYSNGELQEIASLAYCLADRGAEEVYVFFNNDVGGHAPRNALSLRELLGK